jgi:hypothetical protein
LEIEVDIFKKYVHKDLEVRLSYVVVMDVVLELEAVGEVVTTVGAAPLVETASTQPRGGNEQHRDRRVATECQRHVPVAAIAEMPKRKFWSGHFLPLRNDERCKRDLQLGHCPFVLLFSLLSQFAFGQAEAGAVAGTVKDQSGAVVTGATVIVKNLGTNAARITQSSATGDYTVVGLEPATYEVTVTASKFKPFTAKVEVTVGRHVTLAAKLSVGASTTEVRVVAEGGTAVNTQTQELSQIINTQQFGATAKPYPQSLRLYRNC